MGFNEFLSSIFGNKATRDMKEIKPWVDKVKAAYPEIAAHTNEYLYFRTDHHWTARGAYYAYRAFANTAGFTPVEINSLRTGKLSPFLGTLY